jgi:predicted nucleic acid-binding protein
MLFLFDTSVYVRLLLDAPFARAAEPTLRRIAPMLYLSSVVRAELTQGARGAEGRALVDILSRRLERAGRTVTPTHGDWARAAKFQSELWDSVPSLRSKRMLHDFLIALAARRVGARLVTDNEKDFTVIDRWQRTKRLSADDLSTKA